jgi:hypothetical protein
VIVRLRRFRERRPARGRADCAMRAAVLLAREHERGALSTDDYRALYAWCVSPEIDAIASELRA